MIAASRSIPPWIAAELYLLARNPSALVLSGVWDRILKIGQGAMLMTETTLDVKDLAGGSNVLPNDSLAKVPEARRGLGRVLVSNLAQTPDAWSV
jgi:hypothetical protein